MNYVQQYPCPIRLKQIANNGANQMNNNEREMHIGKLIYDCN